jgi:hypothetical protein
VGESKGNIGAGVYGNVYVQRKIKAREEERERDNEEMYSDETEKGPLNGICISVWTKLIYKERVNNYMSFPVEIMI